MEILKIPQPPTTPPPNSNHPSINQNSIIHENLPTTPGSTTDVDQTSQIWIKRTVPITPNSHLYRRQHYRSALHQRSLNSSGDSLIESPKSGNHSLMKSTRSDTNLSLSPISNQTKSPIQTKSNVSLTSSGVLITDYRQSMMMKRIVNP